MLDELQVKFTMSQGQGDFHMKSVGHTDTHGGQSNVFFASCLKVLNISTRMRLSIGGDPHVSLD